MLRLVFRQPLRQTEGLMASIFELLGVDIETVLSGRLNDSKLAANLRTA
jgi:hypothetical protein